MRSSRHTRAARSWLAAALCALALATAPSACGRADAAVDDELEVKLGMAPRDVRDRFAQSEGGTWAVRAGGGEDLVIDWTGTPTSRFERATFEFHLGMLVAARAVTKPGAPGPLGVSVTPVSVRAREASPDGRVGVTLLSRDCPNHKEEVAKLAARATAP